MAERMHLMVDDGIADLMTTLAGGERKRGQWLSSVVRALHEQDSQAIGSDSEALRLGFIGLAGQHKTLDGRVTRVEQRVAVHSGLLAEDGVAGKNGTGKGVAGKK